MFDPPELADLIIVRPGPGLPAGFLGDYDGAVYDRNTIPVGSTSDAIAAGLRAGANVAVAQLTDRLEVLPDGRVAQVFEVRV